MRMAREERKEKRERKKKFRLRLTHPNYLLRRKKTRKIFADLGLT